MILLGDNLHLMQEIESESIDLAYLDPPFNSNRNYGAFDDRWSTLAKYLEFLSPRLQEVHRLLKCTGSIYLHCDPKMSSFLKLELDRIFGGSNFRNQIIWAYRTGGMSPRQWPRKYDVLLFYSKSDQYLHQPLKERIYYHRPFFSTSVDECGRFYSDVFIRDIWDDIKPVLNLSKERVGFPTQKPLALLERILKASSRQDEMILDPFCGSGTTLLMARALQRRFIGIDDSLSAIQIARKRLKMNHA